MKTDLFKIRGKIRNYDWGGFTFIPALTGDSGRQEHPSAEYWLGAHPNDPAEVILESGQVTNLKDLQGDLGDQPLPFLMKILDVRMMLSIQVHPSRPEAISGFEREEATGIPANAPERTYKDTNHKPELAFALSDFWMLHGLRTETALKEEFSQRPSCHPLISILEKSGMDGLVAASVSKDDPVIQEVSRLLIEEAFANPDSTDKTRHDFWIRQWMTSNPSVDRGILMILLMNVVNLQPGEAIYQPDGLIHAYLEGRNIEIMANSDNVLRAGLTSKHIDAPELVKIARTDSTCPDDFKMKPTRDTKGIRSFDTPFKDFYLRELEVPPLGATSLETSHSQILLFFTGEEVEVADGPTVIRLIPGEACFARQGSHLEIRNSSNRTAQIFIGSSMA